MFARHLGARRGTVRQDTSCGRDCCWVGTTESGADLASPSRSSGSAGPARYCAALAAFDRRSSGHTAINRSMHHAVGESTPRLL